MIEYTLTLPPALFVVTRERVRAGKGIRVVPTANHEWIWNTVNGQRRPWALQLGKRSTFTLDELYLTEAEARTALEETAAIEWKQEKERYEEVCERLRSAISAPLD